MKLLDKLKEFFIVFGTQVLMIFLFIEVNLKKRLSTVGVLLIFGLANVLVIYLAVSNKPLFSAALIHINNLDSDIVKEQLLAYVVIFTFLSLIYAVTFLYTSLTRKMLIRHKVINTLGYDAWKKVDDASIYSMLKEELRRNKNTNLSILSAILVVIILCFFSLTESTELEKAKNCIGNQAEVSALRNLNADLDGVNKAINESSELGECLVNELKISKTGTDIEKAQKVLDFISNNINYKIDVAGTRFPSKTIVDAEGDCEDMTALSGTLLKALDVQFYLIHRKPSDDGTLGHIYAGIPTDEYTRLGCKVDNLKVVNLKVIDASGSALVGVRNNDNPGVDVKCRLGGE